MFYSENVLVDHKRLLSREYVRRNYAKAKTTIDTLRANLQRLEQQHTALLDQSTEGDDAVTTITVQIQRCSHIARVSHRLHAENKLLRKTLTHHMKLEGRLQQVIDMAERPAAQEAATRIFRAPTRAQCRRALVTCRDAALAFSSTSLISSGVSFFGWRDQRHVTVDLLVFAFEKSFPQCSPGGLVDRTWAILANPETHRLIFSPSMNYRVHLIQRVDDDTLLFYWYLQPTGFPIILKSVFLMARMAIPGGFMVVIRSIDKGDVVLDEDAIDALFGCDGNSDGMERSVLWAEMNSWIAIQEQNSNACEVQFGGHATASIWSVEVLTMCIRWESLAIGARLLPAAA